MKKAISILLLIVFGIIGVWLILREAEKTDFTYEVTPMTGTFVNKKEDITHTWTGKFYVTNYHYITTIRSEDGAITDFEDKPLYDAMSENSQITIYKIDKYKDSEYIDTEYSLSNMEDNNEK